MCDLPIFVTLLKYIKHEFLCLKNNLYKNGFFFKLAFWNGYETLNKTESIKMKENRCKNVTNNTVMSS